MTLCHSAIRTGISSWPLALGTWNRRKHLWGLILWVLWFAAFSLSTCVMDSLPPSGTLVSCLSCFASWECGLDPGGMFSLFLHLLCGQLSDWAPETLSYWLCPALGGRSKSKCFPLLALLPMTTWLLSFLTIFGGHFGSWRLHPWETHLAFMGEPWKGFLDLSHSLELYLRRVCVANGWVTDPLNGESFYI